MGGISFTAHISNKGSAINSKSKLEGVAKHNLRKYKSERYTSDHITIVYGTDNLMQDVRRLYHEEFDECLKEYNMRQKRKDRKIEDYFEHVCTKNQDIAVEIIIQCGDKDYWHSQWHQDNGYYQYNTDLIYRQLMQHLEEKLPAFRIANAVIHYDEASPHMHIVGVPIRRNCEKGLKKQVSKRNVFTQYTLSEILQGSLREKASELMYETFHTDIREKSKGRNLDLTVVQYKVSQEEEKLKQIKNDYNDKECSMKNMDRKLRITEITSNMEERKLKELSAQRAEESQKLDEIIEKQKDEVEKFESLTSISDTLMKRTDNRLREKQGLVEALDDVELYIDSYLPMKPEQELFCNIVEQGRQVNIGQTLNSLIQSLGKILDAFKVRLTYGWVWFPRFMRWKTQIGDVAPVFTEDRDGYELQNFRLVKEEKYYKAESIRKCIKPESRVGMLEQIKERVREMKQMISRGARDVTECEEEDVDRKNAR